MYFCRVYLCAFLVDCCGSQSIDDRCEDSRKGSLTGLRVAVVGVHAEGNLGDEMETTPLFAELHAWGVLIDAYSASWKPNDPRLRMHSRAVRLLTGVNSFNQRAMIHVTDLRRYDAVISAPGPSFVKYKDCSNGNSEDPLMLGFGVSLAGRRDAQLAVECYSQIWVREYHSLSLGRSAVNNNETTFRFSGELSHSFKLVGSIVKYWQDVYRKKMSKFCPGMACNLVVSRTDNWGNGIKLNGRSLEISTINNDGSMDSADVSLKLDSVIFVTSDPDVDAQHFERLRGLGVSSEQQIMLQTIEEMYGLFNSSERIHIYSDRYHPGVAGHRLGINVSVIQYRKESSKLAGLKIALAMPGSVQKQANDRAFSELHNALHTRLRL